MQETPQQADTSLQRWLDRTPKVVRDSAAIALFIGGIVAVFYVIGLVIRAISEVFNRAHDNVADALRRYAENDPTIQWFIQKIWEPAPLSERFIMIGISVVVVLIVFNWFTSNTKK